MLFCVTFSFSKQLCTFVPVPPSYPLYRRRVQCRSCLQPTDAVFFLPYSLFSFRMHTRRYTRSYLLLTASLLYTSTRPIKLIARSAYSISSSIIPFLSPSFSPPLLKASFTCADTFSSFIPFPHHVCFVTTRSSRERSSSTPPTFPLSPEFAVCFVCATFRPL